MSSPNAIAKSSSRNLFPAKKSFKESRQTKMDKIPILTKILSFSIRSPTYLILSSHVNSHFRESLEFYAFQLWQRFVTAHPAHSRERPVLLFRVACKYGVAWIVRKMLETATELKMLPSSSTSTTTDFLSMFLKSKDSKYSSPTLGYSPLMITTHFAANINDKTQHHQDYVEIVHLLLSYGASVLACDSLGKSAVEIACENGEHEILDVLLSSSTTETENENTTSKISPDARSNFLTSTEIVPLRFAILHNRIECARVLIEKHKCDLTHVDKIGRSILYFASRQGCTEIVRMILENLSTKKDENKNSKKRQMLFLGDSEGRLPIDAARDQEHRDVVKMLDEAMKEIN